MIITVKNLQQQTFTIDFEPDKTVLELKQQILKERGSEYLVEKQKLIYAGVILDDERTIASYKVDDKKFIVVMLTRDIGGSSTTAIPQTKTIENSNDSKILNLQATTSEKQQPPTSASTTSENEPNLKVDQKETAAKQKDNESGMNAATSTDVTNQITYTSNDLIGELANASLHSHAESNLLMGEEYNRTVNSMIEMGYDRAQVERAMAASFNNPERAVEYLINGIPEGDETFAAGSIEVANVEGRGGERSATNASGTPTDSEMNADPFEFLRSQPQFLQMRSLVYQNPDLLQAVLQQIGQTNPALLQLISENQDAFLNMLNQPLDSESGNNEQTGTIRSETTNSNRIDNSDLTTAVSGNQSTNAQRSVSGAVEHSATGSLPEVVAENRDRNSQAENVATIRLTTQDQDAIERLKALGFPEALVLQAYFACEKDEQMAANFLISTTFDD